MQSKFDRSRQHGRELASRIEEYLGSDPFSVLAVEDSGGDLVYRVQVNQSLPSQLSLLLGDAIHNARSALDYLAWQLVIAGGGTPDVNTSFPIADSQEKFNSICSKKLRGATIGAIEATGSLRPFGGGDDRFWRLHKLDIEDKHHLLIPVGAAHASVNVSVSLPGSPPVVLNLAPANRAYPLQDGTAVYRVMHAARESADDGIGGKPSFSFEVAFGEGVIVSGEPIVPTLMELIEGVENAVVPLLRFLK